MSDLRSLPSIDTLLQTRSAAELISQYGRPLTLEAFRSVLSDFRQSYTEGQTVPQAAAVLEDARRRLKKWTEPTLLAVINATGVVLHTNLGRAPLSPQDLKTVQTVSAGYCNLEYDLEKGKRGSRTVHAEELIKQITGAEAALVVNNNAGAVLLVLSALASRRRVVISRTQLVEIGGGFRVPDVMKQSGAKLIEIGTTNRVHLHDYEEALQESPALILRAHHSNFKLIGFTSEPELEEITALAHSSEVPVVDDLGSGALLDTAQYGMAHEPMVQESLQAGVDVVCFSGDKLLGGPQAGIIAGKSKYLQKIKKHPLARALRADKLCLAALSATLQHYQKGEAVQEIPIWRMISATPEQIRVRAERWREVIGQGEVLPGFSAVGGGSLPGESISTFILALEVPQPNSFLNKLRKLSPPIIARIEDEKVVFDPRTVLPEQEGSLLVGLQNALNLLK